MFLQSIELYTALGLMEQISHAQDRIVGSTVFIDFLEKCPAPGQPPAILHAEYKIAYRSGSAAVAIFEGMYPS
jgi:hypothetical protein